MAIGAAASARTGPHARADLHVLCARACTRVCKRVHTIGARRCFVNINQLLNAL
jgi:hypothetical protein